MTRWGTLLVLGTGACTGVELDGNPSTELTSDCTGADDYEPGMGARTDLGAHEVRILDATPDPPDVRDNQWVIEVLDAQSEGVPALPVRMRPWMPLHGHGTTPAWWTADDLGDGTYRVDFRLPMPGLWEFYVDVAGDDTEVAMLSLCAQG